MAHDPELGESWQDTMAHERPAATTPEIAWFGGYRGAIAIETRLLHLIQDDGTTFCREPGILADATSRNISNVNWCDVCVRECQKVRRDA